jgi:hypothetical protein
MATTISFTLPDHMQARDLPPGLSQLTEPGPAGAIVLHSPSPLAHLQVLGNWALGLGFDLPDLDVHRPAHGTVEATREVPETGFPFVVFAVWRAVAQRRAFLCPECGAAVQTS